MSDQPTTINVEGVGEVTMVGTGPWSIRELGGATEIRDATGKTANPTVVQKFSTSKKPNRNVVFANPAHPRAIVEAANATLKAD